MKNNRKISFLLGLVLVFTPVLMGATQMSEKPTINPWWYTPYSAITSVFQKAAEKAKTHPYITWGLGIGAAVAAVISVAGYRMVQANNFAEKQKKLELEKEKQKELELEKKRLEKQEIHKILAQEQELCFVDEDDVVKEMCIVQSEKLGKEKLEQVEKQIELKSGFKYTASMAHLALIVYGGVIFEPKRIDKEENPWFWNDGKLSENKKEYTVTYKNKSYTSVYNNQTEKWEATTEAQMSYLEYYDYLKKRGSQEAFVVFVKYLLGEASNKCQAIFWESKVPETTRLPTLLEVLMTEEKHDDKIVFYHAHTGTLCYLHDFISSLHRCLDDAKETMYRSCFEGNEQYDSADAYIEKHGDETDTGKGHTLMSCNVALFGNGLDDPREGETTLKYFYSNNSQSGAFYKPVKNLAEKIGLSVSVGAFQAMNDLYNKYREIKGVLKQCFISPEYVDQLSYLSLPLGVPYKKRQLLKQDSREDYNVIKEWVNIFTEKTPINKQQNKEARQKAKNNCLTTSNMLNLLRNTIDSVKIQNKDKTIDRLQTRIIHNGKPFYDPQEAEKCGIEIVDYYTTPERKKLREDLRKEMDEMVKKMVLESLKKKSLKGGAENTKLVKNYNETGKCEFLP